MLQFGLHITNPNDELQKIPVHRLFQGIAHPKESLRRQVDRLRLVRTMDTRQYSRLKRELPYFVCGHFHPPYRRREHFAAIEYFVIDLDHFSEAGLDRQETARTLREDGRLVMLFASPGGDGLKLLFRLSEKCYDSGLYSLFYKAFLQALARQYGLEKVIDTTTHDVTRACFLSVDPAAYFNAEATPVVLTAFFDPQAPDAQREVAKAHKELREQAPRPPAPEKEGPSDEVLQQIKQKLNPNFRPRKKKQEAVVPPELESVLPQITDNLRAAGIELQAAESIHYGKQLRVAAGVHYAEVNIFFGRRGFSVVKTTKTGSNPDLAELAYQVIYELLYPGNTNES